MKNIMMIPTGRGGFMFIPTSHRGGGGGSLSGTEAGILLGVVFLTVGLVTWLAFRR